MERDDPGAFGEGGAYGQAYALFNCSMAAATMFGPIFAGSLVENHGWKTMAWSMGVFSFSGAIPCVS
jgi:MFS family permease